MGSAFCDSCCSGHYRYLRNYRLGLARGRLRVGLVAPVNRRNEGEQLCVVGSVERSGEFSAAARC